MPGGGREGDVHLAGVSGFGSGAVSAGALGRDPAGWANPDPSSVDHPVREQGVRRAGDGVEKVDSVNYIFITLCARNFPWVQKGIESVIVVIRAFSAGALRRDPASWPSPDAG